MGITHSPLPHIKGKLPLPLLGGNFYGDFAQFYYTIYHLKTVQSLHLHILGLNYRILPFQRVVQSYLFP